MTISPFVSDAELAEFRAIAEAGMLDTCIITRPGVGEPAFDPATGTYTDPARAVVYTGKCRIQVTGIIANSTNSTAGERENMVQGSEMQLPIAGTDDVAINDTCEMTHGEYDPALVGRKFTVIARHEKTHATSRRLRVEEGTG